MANKEGCMVVRYNEKAKSYSWREYLVSGGDRWVFQPRYYKTLREAVLEVAARIQKGCPPESVHISEVVISHTRDRWGLRYYKERFSVVI